MTDLSTDPRPNFEGHLPRECGEHRTVGPHRAWCYDCGEWCYPKNPCVRCERALAMSKNAMDNDKQFALEVVQVVVQNAADELERRAAVHATGTRDFGRGYMQAVAVLRSLYG